MIFPHTQIWSSLSHVSQDKGDQKIHAKSTKDPLIKLIHKLLKVKWPRKHQMLHKWIFIPTEIFYSHSNAQIWKYNLSVRHNGVSIKKIIKHQESIIKRMHKFTHRQNLHFFISQYNLEYTDPSPLQQTKIITHENYFPSYNQKFENFSLSSSTPTPPKRRRRTPLFWRNFP